MTDNPDGPVQMHTELSRTGVTFVEADRMQAAVAWAALDLLEARR